MRLGGCPDSSKDIASLNLSYGRLDVVGIRTVFSGNEVPATLAEKDDVV